MNRCLNGGDAFRKRFNYFQRVQAQVSSKSVRSHWCDKSTHRSIRRIRRSRRGQVAEGYRMVHASQTVINLIKIRLFGYLILIKLIYNLQLQYDSTDS